VNITTKQIRQIIKEELKLVLKERNTGQYGIGAITQVDGSKSDPYAFKVSLVDLDALAAQIGDANPQEFFKKLGRFSRAEEYQSAKDETVVGFVQAFNTDKLKHGSAGSGGICYYTYEIKTMIGRGFGDDLFASILGLAARNGEYVTIDRNSVTDDAWGWWESRVNSISDFVPPIGKGLDGKEYMGKFDDIRNQETPSKIDDCKVWDDHPLGNRAYKGTQEHISRLKQLELNTSEFFKKIVISRLDEPGFFASLFGATKQSEAEKLKRKLINVGSEKFQDWALKKFTGGE
jgi:hypothetical protein